MSADLNENSKVKMPSWMIEDDMSVPPGFESDEEVKAVPAAAESPAHAEAQAAEEQAAASPTKPEKEKPAEEKAAAENPAETAAETAKIGEKPAEKPAEAKDDSLLGAPAGGDDDSDDFLFSKAAEKADKKVSLPAMDKIAGAETPPSFGAAAEAKQKSEGSRGTEPAAPEEDPDLEKTRAELAQLEEIVNRLDFLSYLKPRINRIKQSGCDPHDLIGLYRMSSKVMLEQLIKQAEAVRRYKSEYDKRMRKFQEDVLFEQSSALITGVTKAGQADARAAAIKAARKAESASAPEEVSRPAKESAPSSVKADPDAVNAEVEERMAVFRRQMEIKDNILMRAKQDAEDAQKRCDKMKQDVDNVRARLKKDLELKSQKAKEALFGRFLPVLDSFDGALKTEHTVQSVDSVFDGLKNIYRQLCDSCAAEGLEPLKTEKAAFDPNFHESMGYAESDEIPEDHVCEELRRGYLLDGKLLRAAMVRLASKPAEKADQPAEKADLPAEKAEQLAEEGEKPAEE